MFLILPPDEKQEYSQSIEEQKPRDAAHKVRSPESFTASLLMRAGPTHPLHCSAVSSAAARLLSHRLPASSARIRAKSRRCFCGGGGQVDVEGGWRAGADRGGQGGGQS